MTPDEPRIHPVISVLSTHKMPLLDFELRNGAAGQIGEQRIQVLGRLLDDREVCSRSRDTRASCRGQGSWMLRSDDCLELLFYCYP